MHHASSSFTVPVHSGPVTGCPFLPALTCGEYRSSGLPYRFSTTSPQLVCTVYLRGIAQRTLLSTWQNTIWFSSFRAPICGSCPCSELLQSPAHTSIVTHTLYLVRQNPRIFVTPPRRQSLVFLASAKLKKLNRCLLNKQRKLWGRFKALNTFPDVPGISQEVRLE